VNASSAAGDGSLVGGDGGCGMNGDPGGVSLNTSLYNAVCSWFAAVSRSGKSMFTGDSSPVGGDAGSAVNNGTMSSNCRTSGGVASPVGVTGATGAVLVCDAVSGDVVDGVVGVSSMGDAALGGMTGCAAGGMMGTTVGAGGAEVVGSDGDGWG